jgi:uncharacterized protein (DUF433 family)
VIARLAESSRAATWVDGKKGRNNARSPGRLRYNGK